MKVGILGSGNMGRAAGVRLAQSGHEIFFGSREKAKGEAAQKLAGPASRTGTLDEAARFADLLVWTIRDPNPANVLQTPSLLDGKVILDLNNRDYEHEAKVGAWFERSIAERLQENAPKAQVVKALNTLSMEAFDIAADDLKSAGAQTFLAGSNPAAKTTVAKLLRDLGLEAIDVGDGAAAYRAVEALGDIIRILMIDGKRGGSAHLKLITLPKATLGAIGTREQSNYA